ncbi:MAG: hypothetical protein JJ850_17030 [Kordiimonadaceae bacterium]|nr:hypothetical protein [Kordiimonadaceae bacterium]MBO6570551.1 hypothetical protein [Kordiimonadaceae bacterium]MBO6966330.1 hypothetical protein [Kordiimonadaceae bacterium]
MFHTIFLLLLRFQLICGLTAIAFSFSVAGSDRPQVSGNIVVSKSNPSLAIKVKANIPFLGRHPIRIRDVAAGERFVFADVDGGHVNRMVILQFEGFLPNVPEAKYQYNFEGRPVVAGYPIRSNPFSFDLPKSRLENPGGESSDTALFLESLGLEPPKTWMMWRSLTAELPERRDELIIFYVENGDLVDVDISMIYDPVTDQSTDFWREFMVGLERRANATFQLAEPGPRALHDDYQWRSVPHLLSEN